MFYNRVGDDTVREVMYEKEVTREVIEHQGDVDAEVTADARIRKGVELGLGTYEALVDQHQLDEGRTLHKTLRRIAPAASGRQQWETLFIGVRCVSM